MSDATPDIYLASPYTSPDPKLRLRRYKAVCKAAAYLMERGIVVVAPIAHGHGIALHGDLPFDAKYWAEPSRRLLLVSKALVVLMLPGWRASLGVQQEILLAGDVGKSVWWMLPHESKYSDNCTYTVHRNFPLGQPAPRLLQAA